MAHRHTILQMWWWLLLLLVIELACVRCFSYVSIVSSILFPSICKQNVLALRIWIVRNSNSIYISTMSHAIDYVQWSWWRIGSANALYHIHAKCLHTSKIILIARFFRSFFFCCTKHIGMVLGVQRVLAKGLLLAACNILPHKSVNGDASRKNNTRWKHSD